jgi:ceramide glucosyltransferase
LGISTDFAAGVLSARVLQGVKFGLGSTLAFPREALEKVGGFEPLADYLADDYELGARIAALGREVVVSDVVVDHHLPAYTFGEFFDHQLRWARAIRDSRKLDYIGLGFTFGLPWALLAVLFARGTVWSLGLLGLAAIGRATMAIVVGRIVLEDRQVTHDFWLIPIRDVLALVLWIVSFTGHTIRWRGYEFVLKDGKLKTS